MEKIDKNFIAGMIELIQFGITKTSIDLEALWPMIHVLALSGKAIGDPNVDFLVIRLLVSALGLAGQYQLARDVAETSFVIALNQPGYRYWRISQAWASYADAYDRSGNPLLALLMLVLSFYAWESRPLSYDLLVRSYRLTARILRDMKLFAYAKEMCELERKLIMFKKENERDIIELDQMMLSIEIIEDIHSYNLEQLEILLQKTVNLLDRSIRINHELLPILALQANLFRYIYIAKGHVPENTKEKFISLLDKLDNPIANQLLAVANPYPKKEELSLALKKASQSNHLDDLVHQLAPIVLIASNAIQTACKTKDIDLFLMASAVLSQPGLSLQNVVINSDEYESVGKYAERAKKWLLTNIQFSGNEAKNNQLIEAQTLVNQFLPKSEIYFDQISSTSIESLLPILNEHEMLIVLAEDLFGHLCRLIISKQFVQGPDVLSEEIWSPIKFNKWQQQYPSGYNLWKVVEESHRDSYSNSEFISSVTNLSIGEAPYIDFNSIIISPSSQLFSFPFAISIKEGKLLGEENAICTIPSTIFLESARKKNLPGHKAIKAWLGAPDTFDETLLYVRDTLNPIFVQYGIEVVESDLPDSLADASIAIVVSHGGMGYLNKFRMVTDNIRSFSTKDFASRIGGCGGVILFVCGAAQVDNETNSSEVRGLTRELLSSNTSTVIASPWSLNVNIPKTWLPPFMDSILSKHPIGFSAFLASQAVKKKFNNPSAWAALQVYGDPEFKPLL